MIARLRRAARRDDGASAVEFALVVPLLLVVVMGIIFYGLWFADSLAVRQGIREGARQGIVASFSSDECDGGTSGENLICRTKANIGGITGTPVVKVVTPEGWKKGEPLIVCAQLEVATPIGLIPLPNDGVINNKVEMSIENTALIYTDVNAEDAAPAGKDWSWCT